ncbi:pyridoxamine kinase [Treponema parvum]|uniref:pyridoxal kinase n=1 Tax=Treponema parvum TaxID=138851 RepID=A0A975EZ86_9SPIR|nr:pyridoxamine kinase [Treponema parvum]QTQ11467.1 pyridoxamine kinase [Treponema parvum]
MKRIVTVQDISCVGKCSLTVALPIISAMGVETAVIPTAVLSTHTAFKGFTFRDLTEDITPILDHWKKEKISFDAIYTGYLGSFRQLELMKKMFGDFKSSGTLIFVDPCMADNGNLYPGFTKEFAAAMAKLACLADIIVPNMTEASFMLDIPYKDSGYDLKYVENILVELAALGAKKVILKGVSFESQKIGVMCYDGETKAFSSYFHEKLPFCFHGTGDIFASVCAGAILRGFSEEKAVALAADFVVRAIKATVKNQKHNWYGVDFESEIPFLVGSL